MKSLQENSVLQSMDNGKTEAKNETRILQKREENNFFYILDVEII